MHSLSTTSSINDNNPPLTDAKKALLASQVQREFSHHIMKRRLRRLIRMRETLEIYLHLTWQIQPGWFPVFYPFHLTLSLSYKTELNGVLQVNRMLQVDHDERTKLLYSS